MCCLALNRGGEEEKNLGTTARAGESVLTPARKWLGRVLIRPASVVRGYLTPQVTFGADGTLSASPFSIIGCPTNVGLLQFRGSKTGARMGEMGKVKEDTDTGYS
jgi:hypothetical protein